jgi:sporulation protein YlmC with PRC-barrel domain
MALEIEDVSSLPGRKVVDQEGEEVGEIKEVYGLGDDGDPMWVVVVIKVGGLLSKEVCRFVPMARLREKDENLSVPYSSDHVEGSPEIDLDDELSEEDDNKLRVYYSVGLADEEFRDEPRSYAAQVPEGDGQPTKITDDLDSGSEGSSEDKGSEGEDEKRSDSEDDKDERSGSENDEDERSRSEADKDERADDDEDDES